MVLYCDVIDIDFFCSEEFKGYLLIKSHQTSSIGKKSQQILAFAWYGIIFVSLPLYIIPMKKSFILSCLALSSVAMAGGFRVSLQGAKQFAMAHTSAHTDDASVIFYNPAGMSFIPSKLSIAAGGFGISSQTEFQDAKDYQTYKTSSPVGTPIYAAVAYKPVDRLSLGFSFTTPYGSSVQWPQQWAGQEIVQDIKLQAMYFQPSMSIKVAPWLSVGSSFIYAKGKVDWTKSITNLNGQLHLLDEQVTGSGYTLGVYLKPTKKLDVSASYRSLVEMKANNGVATFNVPQGLINERKLPATDKFTAVLPLVDEYIVGATYQLMPNWKFSADVNFQRWEKYNSLTLDFESAKLAPGTADPTKVITPKNFRNSNVYRVGTEYIFKNNIAARMGYYFDESPYSGLNFSPETPSFVAHVLTGGLGYKYQKFTLNASGSYNFLRSRPVDNAYYNLQGNARGRAFILGLGLSYNY
jgi:long-chain fatty acid transport protein